MTSHYLIQQRGMWIRDWIDVGTFDSRADADRYVDYKQSTEGMSPAGSYPARRHRNSFQWRVVEVEDADR